MTKEEAAIAFANTIQKMETDCPRGVMNPGLYFGFLEGVKWAETNFEDRTLLENSPAIIEYLKSQKKPFIL